MNKTRLFTLLLVAAAIASLLAKFHTAGFSGGA
jgi:hypothetical protein